MKRHLYLGMMMILVLVLAITMAGCGGGSNSPGSPSTPNGNSFKIVFISDRNNTSGVFNIFSMNSDGSNPTKLTTNTSEDISCPELSPDYSKIVYVKNNNNNGTPEIWVMNVDGTGGTPLYTGTNGYALYPSWTPGGKIIFCDDDNLYIMDTDGSKSPITHSTSIDFFPESALRMSPDGTKILFTWYGGILPPIIKVYTVDFDSINNSVSNPIIQYSNGSSGTSLDAQEPSWSPNGKTITFTLCTSTYLSGSVYKTDYSESSKTDPTAKTLVTTSDYAYAPMFSPDGKKIIFTDYSSGSKSFDIFSINTDGSNSSNLTNNRAFDGYFGDESK